MILGLANKVAQTIVRVRAVRRAIIHSGRLSFQRVDPAALGEVGAFRTQHYRGSASAYLLDRFDANGLDEFDARSFVYVARSGDQIVATMRAVPAPFEIEQYVPRDRLQATLDGDLDRYVEISRMLADPSLAHHGIGSAMAGFCGIDLMMNTKYRGYLAYIRLKGGHPEVKVPAASTHLRFRIPDRGSHEYEVVSGIISVDALWRGIDRVRTVSGRRLQTTSQEHS